MSRLFDPFRAIGYISSDTPAAVQLRGNAFFITSAIGDAFHVYDGAKMNLLFVSSRTPTKIAAIAVQGDVTFAACGNRIRRFRRAKEDLVFEGQIDDGNIFAILLLGDLLLALSEDNALLIWNTADGRLVSRTEFDPEEFRLSTISHPPTYVNKILLGSTQGSLELFNIRRLEQVHRFEPLRKSAVTSIEPSPVVDVVAIGYLDGSIVLHNLKFDETVTSLRQEEKVSGLSFRTDGTPHMASSGPSGDIVFWDLEKRRSAHTLRGAHGTAVATLFFVPGQPLLVTSSADNSLKQWLFDSPGSAEPRLLKHRSGHTAPPSRIRFYGDSGHELLSAGRDRSLRMFSLIRDSRSVELSQGSRKTAREGARPEDTKLPNVITFDSSEVRARDWANVITAHAHDVGARTWETSRMALGKHLIRTPDLTKATAVCVSACGHFALVGSEGGQLAVHNLQSGLKRSSWTAHSGAITGVVSDAVNRLICTTSLDGTLRLWDFNTGKPAGTMKLPASATAIQLHRASQLLALACSDFVLRVIDLDARRVVREFRGHRNRITDLAFAPDARTVVTAGMDGTIRAWDVPTGFMVDCFSTPAICTSLAYSPKGDFLATAHADSVGVYLWNDRRMFGAVSVRQVTEDEANEVQELPIAADVEEAGDEGAAPKADEEDQTGLAILPVAEDGMVTLSDLPRTRWQSLLHLEHIKKRNKPKEPPKAPEQAPFFLPTLPGAQPKFAKPVEDPDAGKKAGSRILSLKDMLPQTEFAKHLKSGLEEDDCEFALRGRPFRSEI